MLLLAALTLPGGCNFGDDDVAAARWPRFEPATSAATPPRLALVLGDY